MISNQKQDGQKSQPKIKKENLKHECTLALSKVSEKGTDQTNKTLHHSICHMIAKASEFYKKKKKYAS